MLEILRLHHFPNINDAEQNQPLVEHKFVIPQHNELGIKVKKDFSHGDEGSSLETLIVTEVLDNSVAELHGLQINDRITHPIMTILLFSGGEMIIHALRETENQPIVASKYSFHVQVPVRQQQILITLITHSD